MAFETYVRFEKEKVQDFMSWSLTQMYRLVQKRVWYKTQINNMSPCLWIETNKSTTQILLNEQ